MTNEVIMILLRDTIQAKDPHTEINLKLTCKDIFTEHKYVKDLKV